MIKNPNDIVEQLVADFSTIFGERLLGISMYGSAVSHEFRPGKSDVNLLFVLSDTSITVLQECRTVVTRWIKRGVSTPLFMTPEYIFLSQSTFPIELLDMQHSYRVLSGDDILAKITLHRDDLHHQCKRELLAISVHLKKELIGTTAKQQHLEQNLLLSIEALLPIFKAILVIYKRKIPSVKAEIIAAVEDIFGLGASVFSEIYNCPHLQKKLVISYYDKLVQAVETITTALVGLTNEPSKQTQQCEENHSPV